MASRADCRFRTIVMALSGALTAGCVHAEPATVYAAEAPVTFVGAPPSAGFTRFSAEMEPLDAVTFYALADRDGGGVKVWWAARLASEGAGGATGRWADSRSCPAVERVLRTMTRLPPGVLTIGGMRSPDVKPRYEADGERYTVWSRAGLQADGSLLSVTLSGTGGELAAWGMASLAALDPCWSDAPPTPPRRN